MHDAEIAHNNTQRAREDRTGGSRYHPIASPPLKFFLCLSPTACLLVIRLDLCPSVVHYHLFHVLRDIYVLSEGGFQRNLAQIFFM